MPKVIAYQVADSIDIKKTRGIINGEILVSNVDEIFIKIKNEQYLSVFKYGGIAFYNLAQTEIDEITKLIASIAQNPFPEKRSDEFQVETGTENKIGYNKISITTPETEVIRMIMLNVSQSVALDYYSDQTTALIEEANYHTEKLERHGRLTISGRRLKKYIGKTLLLKNRIAENLYIFDSPDETWENEGLDRLHNDLKRNFELQDRFRHVSEGLGIVKENLELFKDLLHYRTSVYLEWIIIALIAIEVFHFLFDKVRHI